MDRQIDGQIEGCIDMWIKIYKFSGILKLGVDLKSATNFEDFFYKIRFFYNSLSKSGNAI